jgi:GST-like protein
MAKDIEVFTWPTPNGHKVHIMLEELGLPYRVHAIDIGKGDQFTPDFLKISPNNKIPAVIDPEGPGGKQIALFESGAILLYLAEKTGKLMPKDERGQSVTLQWLMFQMASVGPMLGQAHHFLVFAPERMPYAVERYTKEANRIYAVLDERLAESAHLAGPDYGIADIATYPWLRHWENQGVNIGDYPKLKAWYDAIDARPAVQKGCAVLADLKRTQPLSAEQREILFGAKQYERR